MDKFLLAENPLRPEQSGCFIIHMLNPIAIIRCVEGHRVVDKVYKYFEYKNIDGQTEQWTLSTYHFFTTNFITTPEEQVFPLLDRAWRWYRAYLEDEDNNLNEDEKAKDN